MKNSWHFKSVWFHSVSLPITLRSHHEYSAITGVTVTALNDSPGYTLITLIDVTCLSDRNRWDIILGDPGAASRDDGIFMGESLQQGRESPWALTLTERVPEAFEIPPSDWPEKYFSGQSAKRNSRATLMSSYTRLFSSSNAVVAWPVQRDH